MPKFKPDREPRTSRAKKSKASTIEEEEDEGEELDDDFAFEAEEGDEGEEYDASGLNLSSLLSSPLAFSALSSRSSSVSCPSLSCPSSDPSSSLASATSTSASCSSLSSLSSSSSLSSPSLSSVTESSSSSSPSFAAPLPDTLDDDEEVCYIVADLKKLPEGRDQFLSEQTGFELSQLCTDRPELLFGSTHFTGRFVPTIGTHLIFEVTDRVVPEETCKKKKAGQKLPDRRRAVLLGKAHTQMTFSFDKPPATQPST